MASSVQRWPRTSNSNRAAVAGGPLATMSDRGVVSLQGDSRTHGWGISIKKEGRRPSLAHFDCARRALLLRIASMRALPSLSSLPPSTTTGSRRGHHTEEQMLTHARPLGHQRGHQPARAPGHPPGGHPPGHKPGHKGQDMRRRGARIHRSSAACHPQAPVWHGVSRVPEAFGAF